MNNHEVNMNISMNIHGRHGLLLPSLHHVRQPHSVVASTFNSDTDLKHCHRVLRLFVQSRAWGKGVTHNQEVQTNRF